MVSPYSDNESVELTEELRLLNNSLAVFLDRSSPNLDLALQPTVKALNQILLQQTTLKQEIVAQGESLQKQQKVIDQQTAEIDRLKKQIGDQNQWLKNNVNWQTIAVILIILPIITTVFTLASQKFLLPTFNDAVSQKIDYLYDQQVKRASKNK